MPKFAIYSKDGFLFNLFAGTQDEAIEEAKKENPDAERAEFLSDQDDDSRR